MKLIRRLWAQVTSRLLYKMIILYSMLIVIPLAVIISLFYFRSTEIIETKMREATSQTLVETADKIDGMLKLFAQKADTIVLDLDIYRLLKNEAETETVALTAEEKQQTIERIETLLNREAAANDMIDAIYIFAANGEVYASADAMEVVSYPALTFIANETPGQMGWAFFTDHQRLISAMDINNRTTGRKIGMISLAIKPQSVIQMYDSYSDNSFYIANSGNLIMSAHDSRLIGSRLKLASDDKNTIVNKRTSSYSGLVYYSMIPQKLMKKEIEDLAYFAAGITIAAWVVVLLLTVLILRHITNPLVKLAKLMRLAERENFKLMDTVRTRDEIAQVCNSFNRLITEIQHLIQKVYKTELLKKEADLKAIKMHLNPHFLYNTMESVSILAGEAGSKEVPEMIRTLSRILRFSISPIEDFIALRTEMKLAVSYLQLHKYRYKDRLSWQTEMDEALSGLKVPKLILQPIVENAIIHGIDRIDRPGMIRIRAYEQDFDLWLEVEDDGPGMYAAPAPDRLGTGLANVESRIKIYYGQEYGLSIIKKQDGETGMIVRIRLPISLENKERDIE
ncbi:sensor histidine kinase [Paenibacillus contaminans]|uniref:HAMP domain-containing protein n=1 Tax=Paenibacillus contaminans TaxID=450362 RepID=A0A329MI98_9BACL|nr:histidine kinase [Paenibacillus contaminans]RAV19671.1 hypothetical protein DQG23_19620 [Paenibacillus contaminans]